MDKQSISTKPVSGTRDYLPREMEIRDYLQKIILDTYLKNGFQRIQTPILESSERLEKSDGGENLSLIFKILKRGEKLSIEDAKTEADLVDSGLRYDLTMPLTRYYANNLNELRLPFKSIQIDKVFRAERAQHGRLKEFYQCDIDIIGDASLNAEVELIHTTAKALLALGLDDFVININDRRLLKEIITSAGFGAEDFISVCTSIDKMDKVGIDGAKEELVSKGFSEESINELLRIIGLEGIGFSELSSHIADQSIIDDLKYVIDSVQEVSEGKYRIAFNPALVRGMGYYTETIFEIVSPKFSASVGGGGRYDNMIGKYIKEVVPAVGFSIGFERIFQILQEEGFRLPDKQKEVAVIFDETDYTSVIKKAEEFQREGYRTVIRKAAKKLGKQLARLEEEGLYGAYLMDRDELRIFDD